MSGGLLSSLMLTSTIVSTMLSAANPPTPPVIDPETQEVTIIKDNNKYDDNKIKDILLGDRNNTEEIIQSSETITGIDISSHQHKHDFSLDTIYTAGKQSFAFIKATEGKNYINPHFREDVIKSIENSVPIGFYHYARPSDDVEDAKKQAQYFVNVTGMSQGVKGFDPVLDIEEDESVNPTDLITWVEAYVKEIKRLTGRDTMIYTYPNFWRDKMNNTTQFSHLKLWIADYNNKAAPNTLPGGWKDWTFWQYTSKQKVEGSEKPVDANIFNGNIEELKELYK